MTSILVLVCTIAMPNGQTQVTTSQNFYSERACAYQWNRGNREHCNCQDFKQRYGLDWRKQS